MTRIAFWIMAGAAAALCGLLVLNIFRPRFRAMVIGCKIYIGLYFIAVWLAPTLFQRFMVQPNELARETPYLKNKQRVYPEGLQSQDPRNILPGASRPNLRVDREKSSARSDKKIKD